jgi:hypothetical protein
MPRATLWILAAWLILGPLLGAIVSFAMGEARGQEIILSTVGGLAGGIVCVLVRDGDGDDLALSVLSILVGAIALMLFYDGLEALGVHEL